MKNIVLLGSKGKIGKAFLINKKNNYNIYPDLDYKLHQLLSKSFLLNNNVDFIINCIGSTKNSSFFFHSNFFIPLSIVRSLNEFSLNYDKKITFIHLSSIGVNDPYGRLSISKTNLNIDQRSSFDFNKYELSKCCADFAIRNFLANNEKVRTYIFQPSVIIEKKSQFLKKVFFFLLLFPFRLPSKASPPITKLEYLNFYFDKILEDTTNKNLDDNDYINTLQVFERIPLNKLFPRYKYISFFKIPINKRNLYKIIKSLPAFFPFSSLKRILIFLSFI